MPWAELGDGVPGEAEESARAQEAEGVAGGEERFDRDGTGEGTEEPVDVGRPAGQRSEQETLDRAGGECGEADGEVVHRPDRLVAAALVVGEGGAQRAGTAEPGDDGRGELFGVAEGVGDALRGDGVHDHAGVADERPTGAVRAAERVRLVRCGTQPLGPGTAADPVAEVPAQVQRLEVVALDVAAELVEPAQRRGQVHHGQVVVGGEDGHRAPGPLVQLAGGHRNPGPVGVAGEGPDRSLPVPGGAGRVGDERPLAVGADDQPGGLGRRGPAALPAPDAGDPAVAPHQLLDPEVLPDLRSGGAGGVDQQAVEEGTAGAVERVDAAVGRESPAQDDVTGVEPHPARRWRAGGAQPVQQAPAVQPRHAGDLDLMRGDRVAGKRHPIHGEDPQSLTGQQHGGRGAGHPGADHDHVVPHRAALPYGSVWFSVR